MRVELTISYERFRRYVHVLVAESFIRPIGENEVVNHIDRCKTNNRLDNLEIVSHKINMYHIREFDWVKAAMKAAIKELVSEGLILNH